MDKRRKFKIACSCIITIGLLAVTLKYLTDLMELKTADSRFTPFFEQDEDFDVLFMGSSHVVLSIYPMELWDKYGIISYNMGGYGERIPTTYWVMENALEQTDPKLVVVDCAYLFAEVKTDAGFFYNVHNTFDALPLNSVKLSAIYDLLDDPEADKELQEWTEGEVNKRSGIELWWDYSIYHNRWNELSEDDFAVPYNKAKGAEFSVDVAIPITVTKIPADQKLEGETTGVRYLRKMIEDCQAREIEVLLIYLPFPAEEKRQMYANRLYDIAEEYSVNYINFLDMDVVDYNTDCFDANSHLNPSGGHKVTEYIGQYIKEHYDIADQRNNPAYDGWYEDYGEWIEYKIDNLKETEQLDSYLMLLADQKFEVEIEINNPEIIEDEYYVRLLKNAGIDKEEYIAIVEMGNDYDEEDNPDARITVKDKVTKEIIDQADFFL